ncbi:MAG: hypothetical protein J5755_05580 [Clostridia bacterium]|nr:hypothetical protein [Clostridia bacterium]
MRFFIFGSSMFFLLILTIILVSVGAAYGLTFLIVGGVLALLLMVACGAGVHFAYYVWERNWFPYCEKTVLRLALVVRIFAWIVAPIPGFLIWRRFR